MLNIKLTCTILTIIVTTSFLPSDQSTFALGNPQAPSWATMCKWMTLPWDNDDKPYQQSRSTIDNAINGGRKPQELVELYEGAARRQPKNAQAQFRWAYSAYKQAKELDYNSGEKVLESPTEALLSAPFPRTYEYARLIYLIEDHSSFLVPDLQEISKRIVKRSPEDRDIKYSAARNLIYNKNAADRNLGYQYNQDLLRKYPEWAAPHGLQGFIYYRRWQTTKNKQDGNTAIAEYQNYLRLDNLKDNDFRKQVQDVITEVEKG